MDTYLERLRADLLLRDLQPTTLAAYTSVVREFLRFVRHDEQRFCAQEVRRYLLDLRGRGRHAKTINVHDSALRFWFTHTLGRPEVMNDIPRGKVRRFEKLPDVPTSGEVKRLFEAAPEPFYRTLFQTIYATGMRSKEVRNLRVEHISSEAGVIHVPASSAKGRKPRVVPLGDQLLRLLREHWKRHRLPGPFLFPAREWYAHFASQPSPDRAWKTSPVGEDSANNAIPPRTESRRDRQADPAALAAPRLRDAPPRAGRAHAADPGPPRAHVDHVDADLHPRADRPAAARAQPARPPADVGRWSPPMLMGGQRHPRDPG